MPVSPRHPCSGRGTRRGRCPNLVKRGERCCAECEPHVKAATRRYDVERDKGEGRQFLHSQQWRIIRGMKLSIDPLCERHSARGEDVAATLVHHIDRNETNCDTTNIESLCVGCHELEHRSERWGR